MIVEVFETPTEAKPRYHLNLELTYEEFTDLYYQIDDMKNELFKEITKQMKKYL